MSELAYTPSEGFILPAPGADEVFLVVGGVLTSVDVVSEAHEILQAAPGLMVRQPLARFRNPLALCDYHAEAAPYRDQYHAGLAFRGKGAAGRPATKHAFMHALRVRAGIAVRDAPLVASMALADEAYTAFGADVSYVLAMLKSAVGVLGKQYQWRLRSELRQAQQTAMARCASRSGDFDCDNKTACGTGACRFASGIYLQVSTPAASGRTARPANHGGGPFSSDSALADLERLAPFKVQPVM